jgi:hypothetical protein
VLLAAAVPVPAAEDGPEGIEPFPDAFLVEQAPLGPPAEQRVPVDRLARGDDLVRPDAVRRVQGRARSWTWGHGRGVTAESVYEHLRAQLPGASWFECDGRDCGASTYFANRILGVADLYGRDGRQHYVAVPRGTPDGPGVVMLYVSERGTREVFAHIEEIVFAAGRAERGRPGARLGESLRASGVARLPGDPLADAAARDAALDVAATALDALPPGSEVWIVVHRAGPVDAALAESDADAARLVDDLRARRPDYVVEGRGVGSLVPTVLGGAERVVELVRTP